MKSYILLFARLLLAIILFWQGLGKIATWGIDNVYKNGFANFEDSFLPNFVLKFTVYFTSYGEFLAGILLAIGFFRKLSYGIVALILLIVSFGHGMQSPIWDLQNVFIRAVLLVFIAWFYKDDSLSIDRILFKNKEVV